MTEPTRTEGAPHDRMTRLGAAMLDALEQHPEYVEGVQTIIFLHDGERAGTMLHGYESDMMAMADIFVHLKAVFEANGKTLLLLPVGGG